MKKLVECCEIFFYEPLQKWLISTKEVKVNPTDLAGPTDWKAKSCHTSQIKLKNENNILFGNATLFFSPPCVKTLSQTRGTDAEVVCSEASKKHM